MNLDLLRRIYSDPDEVTANLKDANDDVVADDDTFADFAAQDKHALLPTRPTAECAPKGWRSRR